MHQHRTSFPGFEVTEHIEGTPGFLRQYVFNLSAHVIEALIVAQLRLKKRGDGRYFERQLT